MIDDEEHTRALTLIGVYCGINITPPRHGKPCLRALQLYGLNANTPFADASGFTGSTWQFRGLCPARDGGKTPGSRG